jgi:hypothetical protein
MAYTGVLDMIQNGQEAIIKLGPFLDARDSKTPLSTLTITPADVLLSKNNGTLTAKSQADNAVYDKKGYYDVKLNTTDTTIEISDINTLLVVVQITGALPVWKNYRVSAFAPA